MIRALHFETDPVSSRNCKQFGSVAFSNCKQSTGHLLTASF